MSEDVLRVPLTDIKTDDEVRLGDQIQLVIFVDKRLNYEMHLILLTLFPFHPKNIVLVTTRWETKHTYGVVNKAQEIVIVQDILNLAVMEVVRNLVVVIIVRMIVFRLNFFETD